MNCCLSSVNSQPARHHSLLLSLSRTLSVVLTLTLLTPGLLRADGPADNQTNTVRRVPKLGIEVPAETAQRLRTETDRLQARIAAIRESAPEAVRPLWTDVEIFRAAVRIALDHQEFFQESDLAVADQLLAEGNRRAESLEQGLAPWSQQTGLVVRGYESKLDGSVQPYGLVIPSNLELSKPNAIPLDIWFHGRGETLSELQFLDQRMKSAGQFAPNEAIVLHPYGRYCNANKFAGEVDVYEGLDSVRSRYPIDDDRVTVRGFSMGGASAWQFAVHDPGRWAAANPGAGFSETPEFLQTFQSETLTPFWWEQKLWHLYDATDWASNLRHVPTIAYSGELDIQKQAADAMSRAAAAEGLSLVHLIGPQTAHSYHPLTAGEVERRVREQVAIGRTRTPRTIDFVTYTLRYPKMGWIEVTGMSQHWERARVRGRLLDNAIELTVEGVTAIDLTFEPGTFPFVNEPEIRVRHQQQDRWIESVITLGDSSLPVTSLLSTDRSWHCGLVAGEQGWRLRSAADDSGLHKRPGQQGPIDDGLMSSFLFVEPTGTSSLTAVDQWSRSEMNRAIEHWRRHFRGEVRRVRDVDVTDQQLNEHNVVLWGDSQSNLLWQRMADQLPIQLHDQAWVVGDQRFDATTHAPILIYPNPLAPEHYVVINSSFTFRDFAYLNNARQVPMLPDWAIIGLDEPAGNVFPGRIAAADFFDERWRVKLPIAEPVKVDPPAPFVPTAAPQGRLISPPLPLRGSEHWVSVVTVQTSQDDESTEEAERLEDRKSLGEPVQGAAREPKSPIDSLFWLKNAIELHGFSIDEVQAATGLEPEMIRQAAAEHQLKPFGYPAPKAGDPLLVAPYPGGRHPRIGFLDGAIAPQRETKLSVFTPWDRTSYVVCDFPEAIWSDLGLTYLAHTHIDTIWDAAGEKLEPLEWKLSAQGTWWCERTLPNGLVFGTEALPLADHVAFRMWLVNQSDAARSDLRVQNCVMLKGAAGFDQQTNDNKIFRGRMVACGDEERQKWILVGWDPIDRPWGNAPCPCLHADPKFPDCAVGETKILYGRLSFYSGSDIDDELAEVEAADWQAVWKDRPLGLMETQSVSEGFMK